MVLSVSSGKNSLIARTYFYAFGDSLDHSTDYPLADVVVSLNRWVHRVGIWIWKASGTWEFDDSNQTDLPIATTTLVANQQDYSLPTTVLKLLRVEVKDSSGNYRQIFQIDQSELQGIALTEYEETAGLPIQYDIIGNSLFLYPAPSASSVTLAAGLKIYIAREETEFSTPASYTTADTTQPGFDENFHDILCLGSAYDWCSVNGPEDRASRYRAEIEALHQDLNVHYGSKNADKKVGVHPRIENYL